MWSLCGERKFLSCTGPHSRVLRYWRFFVWEQHAKKTTWFSREWFFYGNRDDENGNGLTSTCIIVRLIARSIDSSKAVSFRVTDGPLISKGVKKLQQSVVAFNQQERFLFSVCTWASYLGSWCLRVVISQFVTRSIFNQFDSSRLARQFTIQTWGVRSNTDEPL